MELIEKYKMKQRRKNISLKSGFIIFVVMLLAQSNFVMAQPELTGFFDVINTQNLTENKYSQFQINQFELDISYAHQSRFSLGTAIAYNNETQNMELAMAFAHYNFINEEGIHPRREETTNHAGIMIGKFDMHFGLDYLSFASPDRPIVSSPLVYEKTIGGWNDTGVDFHLKHKNLSFHAWAVNGFCKGVSLGGNLGYTFLPFFKVGVSHSTDFIKFTETKASITGLDILIETDFFEIKSEYIFTKGVYGGEQDTLGTEEMHSGLYVQVLTQLEKFISLPMFFTLRYGQWNSEADRDINGVDDFENRFTVGLGYQFHESVSARLELLTNKIENQKRFHQGTLQLVVAF